MRIGIVIGRIGGVDGVALETEKWISVLGRMGHEIVVLTGQLEGEIGGVERVSLLPELAFDHPLALEGQRLAFFSAPSIHPADETTLLARLEREAAAIEEGILRWIAGERVDCLLSENASALPFHLTMGMALERVFARGETRVVTHDHDFPWERGERYATPLPGLRRIIERCFPARLPHVRHAVINSAAARTLRGELGLEQVTVVPNVMDFDRPLGQPDAYNARLREDLGLPAQARLLFQVTRIVARKGIETAIQLVHRLGDPAVHLVITGTARDEPDQEYPRMLERLTAQLGLERQVRFAGERFATARGSAAGRRVYSLSDAYACADACTYFSTYEGFGNAFVEAVVARRPILVNSYQPVYWEDIGSLGFETVMIEDGVLTDEAVEQTRLLLADPSRRRAMAERNFELGRQHFSYQALERLLTPLFSW